MSSTRELLMEALGLGATCREFCTHCDWVFDPGEEVTEDRCPQCDSVGTMSGVYGDPSNRERENDVVDRLLGRLAMSQPPPWLTEGARVLVKRGGSETARATVLYVGQLDGLVSVELSDGTRGLFAWDDVVNATATPMVSTHTVSLLRRLSQWLRDDGDNMLALHAMDHDGMIVATISWGGFDPESGAPRYHAIGGGANAAEAFSEALGISGYVWMRDRQRAPFVDLAKAEAEVERGG